MKHSARFLSCALMFLLIALAMSIMSCSDSGSGGGGNSYFGTQSPGDVWSWTLNRDASGSGTFSATNSTTGATYNGNVTTLTSKFLKLGVTASSNSQAVGSTAYAIELLNTAVLVQPAGSNDSPVVAAAQGSCLPQGTSHYNWIKFPNQTWNPATDAAYGTADIIVNGSTYGFSILQYLYTSAPITAFGNSSTCSNGVISSPQPNSLFPTFGVTPSGVMIGDQGTNGGIVGMAQPSANIGSAAILQSGRQFRGFIFMPHPPNGQDKTNPVWSETRGDGLIRAGLYTNFANNVEDSCPGGDSCATLSLTAEVAPGEFIGTMTDAHAGAHPFTMMVNQINGKYIVFCYSYNDVPANPYIVLLMEQ